nr:hypothetical protein [Tanacetum cinerariifolium]
MSSLFADTHNVVAILEKSDAAEGFEQIIDFLSGSYIHYALTVNLHIYVSCIKQFWNSVSVKRSGDVTRLQALVDKKKIVISEAVIREILQLNDAEGVVCLPNEEIFAGLAQIGLVRNVDSSSKFYMYPRFIQLIILNQVGDLSTHTIRFISPALTQKVFANMRRVGKGFSRVETPLFEEAIAENVSHDVDPSSPPHDIPSPSQAPSSPPHQPPCLKNDKAAQQLEIVKLKARVKKLEKINMVKSSKLRRLKTVGTSQRAELYNLDLDHSSKVLSMQKDDTEVQEAAVSTRRRKGVVIRDPEEELPSDTPAETPKVKDKGKGILIEALKPMKKKDHIEMDAEYARKLHEEINKEHEETYKHIDWNAALNHSREEMKAEDQEIIKSINETTTQKAAKRRKLSEEAQEAEDLRKRLEIVEDEDDDVFVKATPLAQKVPVMDYQMVVIDNKP